MTALARSDAPRRRQMRGRPGLAARMARLAANLGIGAVLCLTPITALLALGWVTRTTGHVARRQFGAAEQAPGWWSGPPEAGRLARAFGGIGASIRAGCITLLALMAWTLPFTALWLGAWWAGWENSFNKGYELAAVGPAVFLAGVGLAALLLPLMPLMLAHLATEDRLAAAFQLRRIRSVAAQAGWRLAGLALAVAIAGMPLVALHGFTAIAPDIIRELSTLPADRLAALQDQRALAASVWAFGSLWALRHMAARTYAFAAPRAAGQYPGLWDGTQAADAAQPARRRRGAPLWYALAALLSLALPLQVLVAQFLNHAWHRWLVHPLLTLPWAG